MRNALKQLLDKAIYQKLWRIYIPAGTEIGTLGNTGNVRGTIGPNFGAHLHYEIQSGYKR